MSRIQATSRNTNSELTLDIAPELYPLSADETFTLALAKSLVEDEIEVNGGDDADGDAPKKVKRELWRSEDQGLAADYEYVMYGKVSRPRRDAGWRAIRLKVLGVQIRRFARRRQRNVSLETENTSFSWFRHR